MGIKGYELLVYGLSLISVIVLGQSLYLIPKAKYKSAYSRIKLFFLGIFVVTSMYWIITFPYVGWTHNFSGYENNYSKNTDIESVKNNAEQNRRRIEILERELEQTQSDLEAVADRIKLFLNLAMYGILFTGIGLGVRSFQKDKAENEASLNL